MLPLLLGFMGSLHCAAMCGPLMLSMPFERSSFLKSVFQFLSYQFGRTLAYVCLGVFVGLIGSSIKLFTNQEILSFSVGVMMICYTLIYLFAHKISFLDKWQHQIISPISKLMGKIYGLPFWGFLAGMLNGFIPCGMVYLALVSALNVGSVKGSANFMLLFGIGTIPVMMLVSLGGIYIKRYIKFNPNKLIPWFILFMGALFILRSFDLGIPYLSPAKNITTSGYVATCE